MKTAVILATLLAGVQSFGVAPLSQGRAVTQLYGQLPEDTLVGDQKEIRDVQNKWIDIRMMDREQAAKELSGEWKEAYDRFYEKYDDDMTRMTEIVTKLQKSIEQDKIQKKTKGQKKRDAYAVIVAREAARAGN